MFHEIKKIPNDDVLFIFKIYFQLINHKISKYNPDKSEFWTFVCNYLLSEGSGKTGNY